MTVDCPSCGMSVPIREHSAPERIHCPGCGGAIVVPLPQDQTISAFATDPPAGRAGKALRPDAASAAMETIGTATCPMCGATVAIGARKCQSCGESLAGVHGPDSRPGHGIWRDGNRLVMSKDAELPYVCIKTNQPADGWLRRKLYWHSPW